MRLLLVAIFCVCIAGCITDPDLRPPLMDNSDFSDFTPPYVETNNISTNISIIVSD